MSHSHPLHSESPRSASLSTHLLAAAWGFAEATVFFIVPDVFLTRVALTDYRRALLAGLSTVAGALLGGTLLWFAASHGDMQTLLRAADWIPGISRDLIIRVAQALQTNGLIALFTGVLVGQPYKLYALHAGAQHLPLAPFLLVSLAARLARFTLTTTLAWLCRQALREKPTALKLRLHIYAWSIFYGIYFALMR